MTENVKVPPFENLDFACVDHDRAIRQGVGEVIFAPGKTADQIVSIAQNLLQSQSFALATRVSEDQYEEAKSLFDQVHYFKTAKIMRFERCRIKNLILVVVS